MLNYLRIGCWNGRSYAVDGVQQLDVNFLSSYYTNRFKDGGGRRKIVFSH